MRGKQLFGAWSIQATLITLMTIGAIALSSYANAGQIFDRDNTIRYHKVEPQIITKITDRPIPQIPSATNAHETLREDPCDSNALASLSYLSDDEFQKLYPVSRTMAIRKAGLQDTDELKLVTALMPYRTQDGYRLAWAVRHNRFEISAIDVITGELLEKVNLLEKDPELLADMLKLAETDAGIQQLISGFHPMPEIGQITIMSGYAYQTWRECNYALSSARNDGNSNRTYRGYVMGDWDYHSTNTIVTNEAKRKYSPGSYGAVTANGYKAGYCKFAAACIIRRSTGWAWLPSGYQYGLTPGYNCWTGDVLQSTSPHTAVVYQVLTMDQNWRTVIADVVDSNYIGGDGSFLLGRHPLNVSSYATWWP